MAPQQPRDKLLASLARILARTLEPPCSPRLARPSGVGHPVGGKGMPWQNVNSESPQVGSGPERRQGTADQGAQIFLLPARGWRGTRVSIGTGPPVLWVWYSQGLPPPCSSGSRNGTLLFLAIHTAATEAPPSQWCCRKEETPTTPSRYNRRNPPSQDGL
jgi:hypothetical protein